MSSKNESVLNVDKVNYFLYCYQPLNGVGSGCVIQVEPYRFDSLEDAEKYASILKVLHHNDFQVMTEDEVRQYFNVIVDEISLPDPQPVYECDSYLQV